MRSIHLLNNIKGGDNAYSIRKLVSHIEADRFRWGYSSTKREEQTPQSSPSEVTEDDSTKKTAESV